MHQDTAKQRYADLKARREPFLRRARTFARLTIPSLLPPEGQSQTLDLPESYQGFGARLVTGLASRLMTALLPPGQKFFKLDVPPDVLLQSAQDKTPPDVQRGLAISEDAIQMEVNRSNWRQQTNTGLQYLIATGNILEHVLPDNSLRLFRLDQYCVVRDPVGTLLEFVIEEHLFPSSLSERLAALVDEADLEAGGPDKQPTIELYTWGKRLPDGTWSIHQQLGETEVPDSQGIYHANPFNALRWEGVLTEDYGRAKVEEHYGDLRALDGLSKALIDGAAMASRNITMIRPNSAGGLNLRRRLAKAANGEYVVGNPDDVEMKQFKNIAGLDIASREREALKQELAAAFLLNASARRDAERVTAYELRKMIEELESVLGGVYSMLSQEMQAARLNRLILQMQGQQKLPIWSDGVIEPLVLTGLEALGREQDVQRVSTAMSLASGLPPEVLDYIDWRTLLTKGFNGLSIPDAVRSEEEVQEIQQRRAMLQAASRSMGMEGDASASGAPAQGMQEAPPAGP